MRPAGGVASGWRRIRHAEARAGTGHAQPSEPNGARDDRVDDRAPTGPSQVPPLDGRDDSGQRRGAAGRRRRGGARGRGRGALRARRGGPAPPTQVGDAEPEAAQPAADRAQRAAAADRAAGARRSAGGDRAAGRAAGRAGAPAWRRRGRARAWTRASARAAAEVRVAMPAGYPRVPRSRASHAVRPPPGEVSRRSARPATAADAGCRSAVRPRRRPG